MNARSLLRLAAGLALALFAATGWATPVEAHAGHDGPLVATERSQQVHAAAAEGAAAEQAVEAASDGCHGPGARTVSEDASCCGEACHAAMVAERPRLYAATLAAAIRPTPQSPPELSGPTILIKRPPRPSAALVG